MMVASAAQRIGTAINVTDEIPQLERLCLEVFMVWSWLVPPNVRAFSGERATELARELFVRLQRPGWAARLARG
jgi:hypothetical protein